MKKRGIIEDHVLRDNFFPLKDDAVPIIPAYKKYSEKAFQKEEPQNFEREINSLVIGFDIKEIDLLTKKLSLYFPNIIVKAKVGSLDDVKLWIKTKSIDIVFLDFEHEGLTEFYLYCQNSSSSFEIISITNQDYYSVLDARCDTIECIEKSLQELQLLKTIQSVLHKITLKSEVVIQENTMSNLKVSQFQKDIVGIPTLDGFEFTPIEQIVCCEGMQKYTRLITSNKVDIISSYNIGEFKKLLQPFGFFSPHKSFLINLSRIKKYHKEGTLTMSNGQSIPLARRRKEHFMSLIKKDLKFPIITQRTPLLPN